MTILVPPHHEYLRWQVCITILPSLVATKCVADWHDTGGGGFPEKSDIPFFKIVCGGVLRVFFDADTPFLRIFFCTILLDCTSKVLSLTPIQPLLILSP